MRRFYKIAGMILAIAVLAYFGYYAHSAFDPVAIRRLSTPIALVSMLGAAALYSVIIPMSAWAWRGLLKDAEGRWPVLLLAGIMGSTQLAKYLPGNIAQHAGRTAFAVAKGMRIGDFLVSVTVETMLALLSALVVGIACLLASPVALSAYPTRSMILIALLLTALTLGVLAVPQLLRWTTRRLLASRGAESAQWRIVIPGARAQLTAFAAYSFNYLLIGVGFLLIARAVGVDGQIGYTQLTAAFALSWIAGSLAPGMPAGLGVREGVMALILSGESASPNVLSAILAMRICTMAGDAVWFVIGGWLLMKSKHGVKQ